jgi:hypothetical protein
MTESSSPAPATRSSPPTASQRTSTLEPEDIRRIALAWQAAVHRRLSAKLAAEGSTSATEGGIGTTGSFYAATANGTVYGITLRVALDANGFLQNIEEPQSPTGYLVATGATEAKQQALDVAKAPRNTTIAWPGRLQAIEAQTILEQARLHGHKSDIGGPIDLIEITPKGPIWLAKKPTCRWAKILVMPTEVEGPADATVP